MGGAYCTSFPLRKETRILANWDNSYNSVTVAHELGHAYHDYITSKLPYLLNQYPMTLAETASIFSELLIFEGALQDSSDQERILLIEEFLQDSTQTCVDILSRFYFEKEFFERRKEGDLTPSQISAIMIDAQRGATVMASIVRRSTLHVGSEGTTTAVASPSTTSPTPLVSSLALSLPFG